MNKSRLKKYWRIQIFRFYLIGIINAIFGLSLMALLQFVSNDRYSYSLIYALTYVVVFGISYLLQRKLVWNSSNKVINELIKYLISTLFIFFTNLLIIIEIVEKYNLPFIPSQIVVGFILAFLSFVVSKLWVFIIKD